MKNCSGKGSFYWACNSNPVLRILTRIRRIRMFLGLLNPDPDPLVKGMDPDPSIIKQKKFKKTLIPTVMTYLWKMM